MYLNKNKLKAEEKIIEISTIDKQITHVGHDEKGLLK